MAFKIGDIVMRMDGDKNPQQFAYCPLRRIILRRIKYDTIY